eukprot:TRINITY_DN376_c0_g1_i1.p1 TRINITY_DN376_c0_g1~~TRINITY_DN376_c0_g1_i1.p1  ORF type:complete len:330 (+),score=86.20 TRINITY_DN376_c0_g1_i1:49-1038(+)
MFTLRRQTLAAIVCLFAVFAAATHARKMVVGHRGSVATAPENTMLGFQHAIEQGCDGIETDLQVSKDGYVVLIHDSTVDRTTDGTGRVADMTLAELQALDAGCWKGAEFCGQKIPTFDDLLNLVKGKNIFIVMDQKADGLGRYIRAALDRVGGMDDMVVGSCWTDEQITDLRTYLPKSRMQKLGYAPVSYDGTWWSSWNEKGVSGFSFDFKTVNQNFAQDAHKHLMSIFTWTVNKEADIRAVLARDVDGIITDQNALAISIVNESLKLNTVEDAVVSDDADSQDTESSKLSGPFLPAVVGVGAALGCVAGAVATASIIKRRRMASYSQV